ncbi:MAG TPA: hypothetical protein VLE02_02015 [Nitrosarchaeum sp.]|nr:hypothetical protein [Nitrosarchaeum sp.]
MATFIDLDSLWRDREQYPNSADYQLTPAQVETWFSSSRNISAYPKNPALKPVDFVSTVNVVNLTIPYNEEVAQLPRIYLDFHCKTYDDYNMIYSADRKHASDKFVLIPDKIQSDDTDAKIWIHFKCGMQQTMRIRRNDIISFRLSTRGGTVLDFSDDLPPDPPNPFLQTMCTLEVVPYGRDADYQDNLADYQTQ